MDDGLISFKWNNHKNTFFHVLASLRCKETYTDATLACEGKFYPVHKLVMSTCSHYFSDIFEKVACKSPIVILKDIKQQNLESLLDYMYLGEVDVSQNELPELLRAAECLKIKGLAVPDYLSFGTPNSNVDSQSTSDVPQSEDESTTLSSPGNNIPPAKRCKREPVPESPEKLHYLKNLNLPSSSLGNPESLNMGSQMVPISSSALSFNDSPIKGLQSSPISQLTVTPTKPKPFSHKKIRIQTAHSSKLAKSIKIKKPKTIISHRAMTKSQRSSLAKPPNHKDYHFIHEEKTGIKQELNHTPKVPAHSPHIIPTGSNTKPPPKKRSVRISGKKTDIDLESEDIESSLLSVNLANMLEKNEPIISADEFCNRIGLPEFSPSLIPILEGQELSPPKKKQMTNTVIEELVHHFENNLLSSFMCSKSLKSRFYKVVQNKIMEAYPNNRLEVGTKRNVKKGPLGVTISKVAERINRRLRIQKMKQPYELLQSPPSTKHCDQVKGNEEHGAKDESKFGVVEGDEKRQSIDAKEEMGKEANFEYHGGESNENIMKLESETRSSDGDQKENGNAIKENDNYAQTKGAGNWQDCRLYDISGKDGVSKKLES